MTDKTHGGRSEVLRRRAMGTCGPCGNAVPRAELQSSRCADCRKKTHGGKRKGAGRPGKLKGPVNVSVRLDVDTWQKVRAYGKQTDQNFSDALREIVRTFIP